MDGLTTNGVLLMNPSGGPSCQPTIWREISVCGNVYGLRKTRSMTEKGKTVSSLCNSWPFPFQQNSRKIPNSFCKNNTKNQINQHH